MKRVPWVGNMTPFGEYTTSCQLIPRHTGRYLKRVYGKEQARFLLRRPAALYQRLLDQLVFQNGIVQYANAVYVRLPGAASVHE